MALEEWRREYLVAELEGITPGERWVAEVFSDLVVIVFPDEGRVLCVRYPNAEVRVHTPFIFFSDPPRTMKVRYNLSTESVCVENCDEGNGTHWHSTQNSGGINIELNDVQPHDEVVAPHEVRVEGNRVWVRLCEYPPTPHWPRKGQRTLRIHCTQGREAADFTGKAVLALPTQRNDPLAYEKGTDYRF